jgi:hypothetical protein
MSDRAPWWVWVMCLVPLLIVFALGRFVGLF